MQNNTMKLNSKKTFRSVVTVLPSLWPLPAILHGAFIALSGHFDWQYNSGALSATFLVWASLVHAKFAEEVRSFMIRNSFFLNFTVVTAVVAAQLSATSLFWASLPSSAPEFFSWNTDYRFHLLHVRTILSDPGMSSSLAISGLPVEYHSGPAWTVASLKEILSIPIETSSFLLIPLVSVTSFTVGASRLLRLFGFDANKSLMATVATLALPLVGVQWPGKILNPFDGSSLVEVGASVIENYGLWYLGPNLMLNTYLSLGVIGAFLTMLPRRIGLIYWVTVVAAIIIIYPTKPQVTVIVLIAASTLAVLALKAEILPNNRGWWRFLGVVPSILLFAFLSMGSLQLGATIPFRSSQDFSIEYFLSKVSWPALVTLGTWFAVTILLLARARTFAFLRRKHLSLVTVGILLLSYLLAIGVFLMLAADRVDVEVTTSGVLQGFFTTVVLLTTVCVATFLDFLAGPRGLLIIPSVVCAVSIALLGQSAFSVSNPESGYEFWDNSSVNKALSHVNPQTSLLITSDLAEPSEGYRRFANAHYLSIDTGLRFFLTDINYEARSHGLETLRRVEETRRFFGSDLSDWHIQFLDREAITNIVLSRRCKPMWADSLFEPGRDFEVVTSSDIRRLAAEHAKSGSHDLSISRLEPSFGSAPCLGPQE